jgi:hypothetical protein
MGKDQRIDAFELRSATGGSFVRVEQNSEQAAAGMCRVEAGLHCVVTVDDIMSVDALAAMLTVCKRVGYGIVLQRANATERGAPMTFLDRDSKLAADNDNTGGGCATCGSKSHPTSSHRYVTEELRRP